jgi:two-component system CheB/CheR fusion protein
MEFQSDRNSMNDDDIARTALQHLSELRRALSLERAGASEGEVLDTLLRAARLYAGSDARIALILVDEDNARLKFVASDGLSEQYAQTVHHTPIGVELVPCVRAALSGEMVIVDDITRHAGCAQYLSFAEQQSIKACWSFPVRAQRDKVLGALAACFPAPQKADPYRIEMLEFVAQCAALTIERYAETEERRKSEAQLRASEARYRSLTDVLTSVVWTTDAQGRFVAPQEAWRKYTGQPWEQQQGFGWFQAVHPDDKERVLASVLRAHEANDYYRADGRLWHEASQTYRYCEARGTPIVGANGEVTEWIGSCVDVDDQKQAEAALQLADRRKDEFIAVLAHELRNPMAPIRNAIHILKARVAGDEQLSRVSTIMDRQAGKMARLLDDLLDVSRIAQDKLELRKKRVSLGSILESAIETSRPLLEQQGHHFELHAPADPIYLEADAARLAQAFSNLLNNAAKYTDHGGRIGMTVRQEGKAAVVSVKDNGIGIEADMLPKLFNRFSQAAPALERAQGGLGIGLSLVLGLVEMHGGTVRGSSDGAGRGSEFVVRLPVGPARAAAVAHQEPEQPGAARMRILVADDNQDTAETLSVLLGMMGHEVREAADGQEAVDLATSFRPAVALLDIGMPKVNGYDAATRIRATLPGVLLVAMTGWGQEEDMRKATAAGFDHHLVKPVNPQQLERLLAALSPAQRQGS